MYEYLKNLVCISIHALREESDQALINDFAKQTISIHALREESDKMFLKKHIKLNQFQSTLSVRRATRQVTPLCVKIFPFQSTLSVRRATMPTLCTLIIMPLFQSTLSVRRATTLDSALTNATNISIHALREESDDV